MQSPDNELIIELVKVLGSIIKRHRLKQNKSMYKISAECSIHKDSWRLIEKGLIKDVKLSTLWKIADGLDMSLNELITELQNELGTDFVLND